jgi:hypothetical protein
MSVYVTMKLNADLAAFEKAAADHAEAIARIMEVAKSKGLVAHRWFGTDGTVMAVDEWPDGESFQAFFDAAGEDIGPFMADVGASAPPEITVWQKVAIDDVYGWGG